MNEPVTIDPKAAVNTATLVYILQALTFFTAISFFISIIVVYVKQEDVVGTVAESHLRWQKRTFWFGVLYYAIGAALTVVVVGFGIIFITTMWLIYRIIKGWLRLSENREMY